MGEMANLPLLILRRANARVRLVPESTSILGCPMNRAQVSSPLAGLQGSCLPRLAEPVRLETQLENYSTG